MKISTILEKRPTISFEIFPPKKYIEDVTSIYNTIEELVDLKPDFISVTYGAGGSTTSHTTEIASHIKNTYGIEAVAHLSCIDTTKKELLHIVSELKAQGIENILALRGDYPKDYDVEHAPKEFQYASELVSFLHENFEDSFCISGACYPEVHQDADSLQSDLLALKKKVDAGAEYLITQIFLDNNYYYRLVREARKIGITVPILAGIMPTTNGKQLLHIAKLSGCSIPYELSAMIERFADDEQAMYEVGLNYATYQIMDLITNGVDGIHLYTMNKPRIAKEILSRTEAIQNAFRKRD
ncbi:MAG: methylenetetrahydrofolate reductase [NAD(P)H] [Lachnospiraceae bacterium]